MRTTLTNQMDDKTNTDKKNKDAKEAAEAAINDDNRNYKEAQNQRRLELRAAEKAEKLNDIVRH